MKYQVIFNPEARVDLLNLYSYIAERSSEDRAFAYIQRIEEVCLSLRTFPQRGKEWKNIGSGIRVLGFERRVSIAFKVSVKTVVIFRVLYGGRDLQSLLK